MCPIFLESVHNFYKYDNDIILQKNTYFQLCSGLVPDLIKKSWTVSNGSYTIQKYFHPIVSLSFAFLKDFIQMRWPLWSV